MQGIMELIFDTGYLLFGFIVGILLTIKGKTKYFKMFGIMTIVLAFGDSFHLIPRVYALLKTGNTADYPFSVGLGKLITSITMTVFYVILYFILESVLLPKDKNKLIFRITTITLASIRIILCAFPQNAWFTAEGNLTWGIIRNIPFVILGIFIITLCFITAKSLKDKSYTLMGVLIILSFGFYIPVVLFASKVPIIGMLMLPKTIAYVGIIIIGLHKYKKSIGEKAE